MQQWQVMPPPGASSPISQSLYGLAAGCLNKSERRRIGGFQNRCLRSIWGIKTAYISRVSNARVLELTGQRPLTRRLEYQQLVLFGKVARLSDDSIVRESTFCPGCLRPAAERYVRKVGRPRLDWATEIHKLALAAAGSLGRLDEAIVDDCAWRRLAKAYAAR